MTHLTPEFFERDTLRVARDLLGQVLVRMLGEERLSGRIVEVEAYVGEEDQASHARCGRTERNAAMYGPPGRAYVYFVYGMHHCLNLVAGLEGFPAAVLVRALEPLEGLERMRTLRGGRPDAQLTNGPAKLCQALAIDRRFDGADLCVPGASLFLEAGQPVREEAIATGPRVGVRGDQAALTAPWRFYLRESPFVSRAQ
jgi:DNA-3-methyladenine glycosylase